MPGKGGVKEGRSGGAVLRSQPLTSHIITVLIRLWAFKKINKKSTMTLTFRNKLRSATKSENLLQPLRRLMFRKLEILNYNWFVIWLLVQKYSLLSCEILCWIQVWSNEQWSTVWFEFLPHCWQWGVFLHMYNMWYFMACPSKNIFSYGEMRSVKSHFNWSGWC